MSRAEILAELEEEKKQMEETNDANSDDSARSLEAQDEEGSEYNPYGDNDKDEDEFFMEGEFEIVFWFFLRLT